MTNSTLPSNIKAEEALLGILLYNNAAFEYVPATMVGAQFFDPLHGRIFDVMMECIARGQPAEPIMLMERFRHDESFEAHGGIGYLADLVDRCPSVENTVSYIQTIQDLAIRRGIITLSQDAYAAADKDRDVPASSIIETIEQRLYDITSEKAERGLQTFSSFLSGALEGAAAAYERDGATGGLSTGISDLDAKMGGLSAPDLIVLGGRPSMGKTALATNIAFNLSRAYAWEPGPDGSRKVLAGGVVAFFSLEMSGEQLATRILAERSGISGERIAAGDFDISEFGRIRDAAIELQDAPLYIDATGGNSIGSIATRARRLKRTVGLDLIIIDYLQLVRTDNPKLKAHERVSEVSQGLKALAKDLHVPVIALSQLSRDVDKREDKRPVMSDLGQSGAIEQDADIVMFCYREAYYKQHAQPKEGTPEFLDWEEEMDKLRNMAEVIIAKRRGGRVGRVKLQFEGDITRFSDLPKPSPLS